MSVIRSRQMQADINRQVRETLRSYGNEPPKERFLLSEVANFLGITQAAAKLMSWELGMDLRKNGARRGLNSPHYLCSRQQVQAILQEHYRRLGARVTARQAWASFAKTRTSSTDCP